MDIKEFVDTAPITSLVDNIGVKSVFGEPIEEDGVVIIPVAQVEYGFGYGGGYGTNANAGESEEGAEQESAEEDKPGEGGGGGGGAGGRATPRGFIRITADEVTYKPISDDNRIPLAGIFMIIWSVFWVAMTIRALIKSVAKVKKARA